MFSLLISLLFATVLPAADAPRQEGAQEERALYSRITRGAILGTITFTEPWQDYRGQTVPAGTYELHYAVQPLLKDHAGTSQWRDFAILPGSAGHPYVMALVPPEEATVILYYGDLKIGLLLEGTADTSL
jgi:hypothetical protein